MFLTLTVQYFIIILNLSLNSFGSSIILYITFFMLWNLSCHLHYIYLKLFVFGISVKYYWIEIEYLTRDPSK